MALWDDDRSAFHDGVLIVEFTADTEAFLSLERAMSPDDPGDDAREVIMLGMVSGPWADRDEAVSRCKERAESLMAEAGYL
ncbi:hypothetical protein [Terrihabitans sp. B22-R8]|uniref:hypothetical protein n=1 Tax=Terrihabitans sp. B22-R8 TaxID=3425128 RepID=UPI00403C0CE1